MVGSIYWLAAAAAAAAAGKERGLEGKKGVRLDN